jgi:putative transposase
MSKRIYPSDLTDEQWQLIEPHIPPPKPGGRPREVDMRRIINGVKYFNRSGCQWRMLPREFGPWPTVHEYYRRFRRDGTWEKLHEVLREQVRREAGREPTPSAGIIDSQSVKSAEKGEPAAMTRAKRSTGVSATSSWIRWA